MLISLISWITLLIIGFIYIDLDIVDLILGVPDFLGFFFSNFLPPNFSGFLDVIDDVIQMLAFSFIAMFVSTIFSFVMALLMSEAMNPIAPIRFIVRAIASFMRNIPTVIWASIMVYIFGIGPASGIIALMFGMSGFLIKTYADTISDISGDAIEAMRSTGANRIQTFYHGIFPQFMPALINWTLYAFEIGVRASSILGIVGAGGIGVLVNTRINLFDYQSAMALVIYIIAIVLIVEWGSTKIRRRVR